MTALQVLALVALGVTALLCLRYPDAVARIIASNVRPRVGQEPGTRSQDLARLIRQGSPEWKTKYPEFYGVIKGIGYIAIGFLAFLLVALVGNALMG